MSVRAEIFRRHIEESRKEREEVRNLWLKGRPLDAEEDQIRAAEFVSRQLSALPSGREAQTGDTNDLQGAWFLARGAEVRRTIAFVEVSLPRRSERGTGFLVSPFLFLTNQHVIRDEEAARATQVTFDFERDMHRLPLPATIYKLDPDRFALFSPEGELDYALVALGPRVHGAVDASEIGYCILSDRPDKHAIGMNVNIIQHPSAMPKMVALRNNLLTYRTKRTLLYETDTEHGSSGAPVFNDFWELVALHHYGEPFLETVADDGKLIPNSVNEGVRISAIYANLAARLTSLSTDRQALLRQALDYDKNQPEPGAARVLKPRPPASEAETSSVISRTSMNEAGASELRISVPLEITIRLGGTPTAPISAAAVSSSTRAESFATAAPPKQLRRGAEALHIDEDYESRTGYNPKFISGVVIPLPKPNATLARQIAPLLPGNTGAEDGELKYEHFSLKLNKRKRMAVFSATNINGKTYLAVDRDTGRVREGAEGDKWFLDPRVDAAFYLTQPFYSDWSDYFDRGHLTRRTDPTWGDEAEAERANADTFHFTNCSPQHFRFNQTAKFWQGAERFVLENGVLSSDSKTHITVFQGPIFDSQNDLFADDVQIPSAFFKVIVWKGQGGMKSVGLIVDQSALLSETRRNLGQPQALPAVDVSQWRVPIASIERRTGLSFGNVVTGADTIRSEAQPAVGEAILAVKSFQDLLPQNEVKRPA